MSGLSLSEDSKNALHNESMAVKKLKKLFSYGLCLAPFMLFYLLFEVFPLVWVLVNSFVYEEEYSLENYMELFNSEFMTQAFENSLYLAIVSSIIALVLALLFINSIRTTNGKIKNILISLVNICSNFSGVPLAFAFIIILGVNGAVTLLLKNMGLIDGFNIYGSAGILTIYVYFQIPIAILLLYPAFDAVKEEWHEAARLLGATNCQYARKVVIQVLAPSIFGTFVILFANAIGAYASVYALTAGNYNVVTVRIAALVSGDIYLDPNLAAAISVILMVIMLIVVILNSLIIRRYNYVKNK